MSSAHDADGAGACVWCQHLDLFRRLYLAKNKSLKEVKNIAEHDYGFPKTPLVARNPKPKEYRADSRHRIQVVHVRGEIERPPQVGQECQGRVLAHHPAPSGISAYRVQSHCEWHIHPARESPEVRCAE